MAAIRWIIGFMITICIAILAITNRNDISFTWSPIHDAVIVPLYVIALISISIGFIFGGSIVWINAGKTRAERRKQKKEIKNLEVEITLLKENQLASDSAIDITPILPKKQIK